MQWQRVEKPEFGYAVQIPDGWEERPPDLRNSPWETARFVEPGDRRHSVIVFRSPGRPGRTGAEMAERAQHSLASAGFDDFEIAEAVVDGRPAARLDCARYDAGRVWAVREYFVAHDGAGFCLGCGSAAPEEDETLFAGLAERFELLTST